MAELELDNILSTDDINNLFLDNTIESSSENQGDEKNKDQKNNEETTEEVNVDSLFTDVPESVGSGEHIEKEKEDTSSTKGDTSPKNNFYSSIAKALKEEGIFPDLKDDDADKVMSAEDFREIVENQIKAGIEERQRRIDDALNAGVETTEIQKYENILNYLNSIKEDNITDESDKGENLRKQLIYQDFINRGYSKERATREVTKSFNAGSDIDDAKEALASNKQFFESSYNDLIQDAKDEDEKEKQEIKKQAEELRKSMLDNAEIFGTQIDKSVRQKAYDSISKPVYKDPESGKILTEIQKYEKENRIDFLKNVGMLYALTDGFKSIDKLVNGRVKKEVKKGLKELESTLNNTARNFDGSLNFANGSIDDKNSGARGWDLDI